MRRMAICYIVILLYCYIAVSGCAHCSRTVTDFNGKTKGFNPYGDGTVTMKREAYWGNLSCIRKLIKETYGKTVEPVAEIIDIQGIDFTDVVNEAMEGNIFADE